jgi:hypothetical protein
MLGFPEGAGTGSVGAAPAIEARKESQNENIFRQAV